MVSSDTALRHEARLRRCRHTDVVSFIQRELFPTEGQSPTDPEQAEPEKPESLSSKETDEWIKQFGLDSDDEEFDGKDAMKR